MGTVSQTQLLAALPQAVHLFQAGLVRRSPGLGKLLLDVGEAAFELGIARPQRSLGINA